ncbi:adenylyl-sulfate kinase [Svornostia abyssi]|uniref:adenylyl-sulfate kinase n=1 Tax=Svornostia abyssi TaxID=2898438 RepID=UPI00338FCADE
MTGATVWFTGLPASGKSTLADASAEALVRAGRTCARLDGDEVRRTMCADLGFSAADRAENVRRVAAAACALGEDGTIVLVSLVSPPTASRETPPARCTRTGVAASSRCTWPRPSRSARNATRRGCTRAPAAASCRV